MFTNALFALCAAANTVLAENQCFYKKPAKPYGSYRPGPATGEHRGNYIMCPRSREGPKTQLYAAEDAVDSIVFGNGSLDAPHSIFGTLDTRCPEPFLYVNFKVHSPTILAPVSIIELIGANNKWVGTCHSVLGGRLTNGPGRLCISIKSFPGRAEFVLFTMCPTIGPSQI